MRKLSFMVLGLLLMAAPAMADQIVICQSCTSAPGGDPNLISNTGSFDMFLAGASSTSSAPTLVIIAEYNGGGTPTVNIGGNLSLAAVGTLGLSANTVTGFNSVPPADVLSALGLNGGGSLNLTNMQDALAANGIAAATSFNLYAFLYNSGLTHTATVVSVSGVDAGSFIFAYGCATNTSPNDCTGGSISQTVFTNSGLALVTPEPASLILLGAGLAGIGVWRRKATKI